jgi:GxxExxY protein
MSTDTLKGDGSEQGLLHKEITGAIIGAAMHVLNTLKPGLDEKLYEKALIIELRKRGHRVNDQIGYPVYYDQQLIGELIPDLIVDDLVIVDTKTVSCFVDAHIAQVMGYLAITGLRVGLLLNFKYAELKWKRIVR